MLDPNSLSSLTQYVPDAVLILISGSACLYCAALNKRLKNLNNLKTGVGASIVSLTEAIAQTHKAAQDAQTTTLQTTETLRHLLERAENSGPKIEALMTELDRACELARTERKAITDLTDNELKDTMNKARATASSLLKLVSDIEKHKQNIENRLSKASLSNDTQSEEKDTSDKSNAPIKINAIAHAETEQKETYHNKKAVITDLFEQNRLGDNNFRPRSTILYSDHLAKKFI